MLDYRFSNELFVYKDWGFSSEQDDQNSSAILTKPLLFLYKHHPNYLNSTPS